MLSWNAFTGDADFSAGYAYAAELVPAQLVTEGVPLNSKTKACITVKSAKATQSRFLPVITTVYMCSQLLHRKILLPKVYSAP